LQLEPNNDNDDNPGILVPECLHYGKLLEIRMMQIGAIRHAKLQSDHHR